MRRKQRIGLLLALMLAAGVLSGCAAETPEQGEDMRPLIVVGVDNYPPYTYIGATGLPTGIDVELAAEAFGRMGYRVEYRFIDWADKKELVESGEIDCIWCSFTMDGREEDYRWAGPYMVSRQVVAVMPDSDIETLSDLADRTLAVQATTKPEELFLHPEESGVPELRALISLQNREPIYPFLSKGYADAVAAHETSILQYMADYSVTYRILDEPLLTVGLGAAFAKNDTRGLERELDRVLAEMRGDGTAAEIIGAYLPDAERYLEVGADAD